MKYMYNGQCLGVCQMLDSNQQEYQIQLSLYVMRDKTTFAMAMATKYYQVLPSYQ